MEREGVQKSPFPLQKSALPHLILQPVPTSPPLGIVPLIFCSCSFCSEGKSRAGVLLTHTPSAASVLREKLLSSAFWFFQEGGIPSRRFVTAPTRCSVGGGLGILTRGSRGRETDVGDKN